MGSWNETCVLSSLPILSGDEAGLIYIKSKEESCVHSDGIAWRATYPTDIWEPCTLPIWGNYYDYGRIDISSGQEALIEKTEKWLAKLVKRSSVSPDACHLDRTQLGGDCGFHVDLAPKSIMDPIQLGVYLPVLVRKDVWDAWISLKIPRMCHSEQRCTLEECYQDWFDTIGHREYEFIQRETDLELKKKDETRLALSIFHNRIYLYPLFAESGLTEDEIELVKQLWFVDNIMSDLRRAWFPTSSSGSQSQDWDVHIMINNVHNKIAKACKKNYMDLMKEYG